MKELIPEPRRALTEQMLPRLDARSIERLRPYGTVLKVHAGELVFARGVRSVDFFVVLTGMLEVHEARDGYLTSVVARLTDGQFTGELDLLSRRETLVECVAVNPAALLRISRASFDRIMRSEPDLAEIITMACIRRRTDLIEGSVNGVLLLGRKACGPTMTLQRFLVRNGYPHRLLDVDSEREAQELLRGFALVSDQLPLAILPDGRLLQRPDTMTLADALGLSELVPDGETFDLAIVGAGPAGLAAAVYAASEGLRTIVIEGNAPGGQAGTSSKIENYLGFPVGISGQELAERAQVQAQKFGATLAISRNVLALNAVSSKFQLALEGGQGIKARALVLATGARYRKLHVPQYDFYESRGISYAATQMEAALCLGKEVIVVGGGNSAGQAAVFLAQSASHIHILVRAESLRGTMSDYLVQRIRSSDRITLHTSSQIVAFAGKTSLERVTWKENGLEITRPICNVFVMIGADPNSDWLRGTIEMDAAGFVLSDITNGSAFSTSMPGVFAVGDVRSRSIKRVAAAAGEGSAVVADVHNFLSTRPEMIETTFRPPLNGLQE